jgi:hypothetical protein
MALEESNSNGQDERHFSAKMAKGSGPGFVLLPFLKFSIIGSCPVDVTHF